MCNCKNIELGSFDNQIEIYCQLLGRRIWVDACIADEVISLWNQGVVTTGCCCGHNKTIPSIVVAPESITLMESLGYKHFCNPHIISGPFAGTFFYAKSVKCSLWIKLTKVWLPYLWWKLFYDPRAWGGAAK